MTAADPDSERVRADRFSFDGPARMALGKPSPGDVLSCDGELAAPDDGTTGTAAAVLGAGFDRTTLISRPDQATTDPATFYGTGLTDHRSKAVHAATEDGKAYGFGFGFGFNDAAGFASCMQDNAPAGFGPAITPLRTGNPTRSTERRTGWQQDGAPRESRGAPFTREPGPGGPERRKQRQSFTQILPSAGLRSPITLIELPQTLACTSMGIWMTLPDSRPGLSLAMPTTGLSSALAVPAQASSAAVARPTAAITRLRMENSCHSLEYASLTGTRDST